MAKNTVGGGYVIALILVLIVGLFIGGMFIPRTVTNTVTETKTCADLGCVIGVCDPTGVCVKTETVPEIVFVDRNFTIDKPVFDMTLFRDEAWSYVFDEGWSDLKYCDGTRYHKDEILVDFSDEIGYEQDSDNKYITFIVELEYDSDYPHDRCLQDYQINYHVEEGEDPEFEIISL